MNELSHYGIKRRSGRYPWGSGKNPYQSNKDFYGYVRELRKEGLSDAEIARGMGITSTKLRAKYSIGKDEIRQDKVRQALKLKDKGYSDSAIGRKMGINESSVRSLLDPVLRERSNTTKLAADKLKENVDKYKFIDVGVGVESHMGISRTKLKTAIALLEEEGYTTHTVRIEQLGTGKQTNTLVLAPPGTEWKDVAQNKHNIRMPDSKSDDYGRTYTELGLDRPVQSVSSDRILVRYAEDGGALKDGVIEIRRGAQDLSLGNANYAQVRIGVDDTHFLKGMAMYSDDMPDGVDIIFNTNKHKDVSKFDTFKKMKTTETGEIDTANPFGSTIKQGGQRGAINIVNEEGDWESWAKTLSSQMLSKQKPELAKRQLGLAFDLKREEYNEISSLTNPAVKKRLLLAFADDCDSSAVHLKAASLPRTANHVILPITDMRDNEIYAPNYRNGERVVLIRHPHGGTFEIPELVVNNRHPSARRLIGQQAKDAVGINANVAQRLSGADFDGDTVLVIPNNNSAVKTSAPLKGLENFDPIEMYKITDPSKPKMSPKTKGLKMGDVSNLITDMTIKGATPNEIARAVRHSMVVIDAEKHHLDYKQSYIDNGIAALKEKYQGSSTGGASTLISRAKSEVRVPYRKEGKRITDPTTGKTKRVYIDPETGKKLYDYVGGTYVNKKGKTIQRTIKSTRMAEESDAFNLSSGTPMETIYATYANKMKALANESRKQAVNTKPIAYSSSAKQTYAPEVSKLLADLNLAKKNKPLEREAQRLANARVAACLKDNPGMEADDIKKLKYQALLGARKRTGAERYDIKISDRQWEAIQAGAISNNTLTEILNHTDLDRIKKLATPRTNTDTLTPAKEARIKAMLSSGYTQAEIADALGVSTSTVSKLSN